MSNAVIALTSSKVLIFKGGLAGFFRGEYLQVLALRATQVWAEQ